MNFMEKKHGAFVSRLDRTAENNPLLWLPCVLLLTIIFGTEHILSVIRQNRAHTAEKPLFMRVTAAVLAISLAVMFVPDIGTLLGLSAFAGDTQTHSHDGWTAWESGDSLPTDAGSYYLANDVTLNAHASITGNIKLCLNGHTIQYTKTEAGGTNSAIEISSDAVLDLYDCKSTGKITSPGGRGIYNEGTLNMYGGEISGCNLTEQSGAGVYNTGTFNMYGGKISNNNSGYTVGLNNTNVNGGGVCVFDGTFNMYGGEISGNCANAGGGVNISSGTFNMAGGVIKNNTAVLSGGGVDIADQTGNVTISGEISGNKTTDSTSGKGGGINIHYNSKNPTIKLSGATIKSNASSKSGGGVFIDTMTVVIRLPRKLSLRFKINYTANQIQS